MRFARALAAFSIVSSTLVYANTDSSMLVIMDFPLGAISSLLRDPPCTYVITNASSIG